MNPTKEQTERIDTLLGSKAAKPKGYYERGPAALHEEESQAPSDEAIIARYSFLEMLNDHIVINIDAFRYTGKIIIPDKAKHMPTKGLVVAVADNIKDIKVGDRVLISQFAGYLLKFENTPLARCISYSEVLSKLKKGAPDLESESA